MIFNVRVKTTDPDYRKKKESMKNVIARMEKLFMICGGFYNIKEIDEEYDYTEYLGPKYDVPERAST